MKVHGALLWALLLSAAGLLAPVNAAQSGAGSRGPAAPRFEKVSDHACFLDSKGEAPNVTAIVSREGTLLINPPSEPALQAAMDALKKLNPGPVRWVVNTDYLLERSGGSGLLAAKGAALLSSYEFRQLASRFAPAETGPAKAAAQKSGDAEGSHKDSSPHIIFSRQLRLYPDNLEVRIIAVQHKARTGGDIVVFVPSEKVLITGEFFESGNLPRIDPDTGGSASGWIDGLKQVIDAVPLLKSAMPAPKPDPNKPPPEEKSLEEQVTVIPGHGSRSNLQEMKDLLEAAVKLRSELTKAAGAGRSRESILNSGALGPARSLGNFESFANQLFDEVAARKTR